MWQTHIITSLHANISVCSADMIDLSYRPVYWWASAVRLRQQRKTGLVFLSPQTGLSYFIRGTFVLIVQESFLIYQVSRPPRTQRAFTPSVPVNQLAFWLTSNCCLTSTAALACWKSGPTAANSSTQASADSSDTWRATKSNDRCWQESVCAGYIYIKNKKLQCEWRMAKNVEGRECKRSKDEKGNSTENA